MKQKKKLALTLSNIAQGLKDYDDIILSVKLIDSISSANVRATTICLDMPKIKNL